MGNYFVETLRELLNLVTNYPALLSAPLIPYIVYLSKSLGEKIKINKFIKVQNAKRIQLPPELKPDEIEKVSEDLMAQKLGDDILTFFKRVAPNIPEENMTEFLFNIRRLIIFTQNEKPTKEKRKFRTINKMRKVGGLYYNQDNKIFIFREKRNTTLFHELMHMASNSKRSTSKVGGLETMSASGMISCTAINEGVTEFLTQRFFPEIYQNSRGRTAYQFETTIAKAISELMGEEFLEKCYFGADFSSFFNELVSISSYSDAVRFITSLDDLHKFMYDKNMPIILTEEKKTAVEETVQNAVTFLLNSYSSKLDMTRDPNKAQKMRDFTRIISGNYYERRYGLSINYDQVQGYDQAMDQPQVQSEGPRLAI